MNKKNNLIKCKMKANKNKVLVIFIWLKMVLNKYKRILLKNLVLKFNNNHKKIVAHLMTLINKAHKTWKKIIVKIVRKNYKVKNLKNQNKVNKISHQNKKRNQLNISIIWMMFNNLDNNKANKIVKIINQNLKIWKNLNQINPTISSIVSKYKNLRLIKVEITINMKIYK